jgi:hypothetical protein
MIRRVRRRLAHVLDRRFFALHDRVAELSTRVDELVRSAAEGDAELRRAIDDMAPALRSAARDDAETRRLLETISSRLTDEIAPALQIMAGNDGENRRLLEAARCDPEYELAFTEPEPLVTVVMPTFGRAELLTTRALPSVLAQSYERLQVLVIGDATDADTETAVREIDDPRVTFANLTQRYVHPDPHRHWLAAATLARNEGYRLAQGRWLVDVDDDDAVPPDALECLVEHARERMLETVQGVIRHHWPDGHSSAIVFGMGQSLSLTGAVVHAHLRFFTREHVAAALGVGGDVFRGERMLRAGVRIGVLDRVTYEYYPASLWQPS